MCHPLLCCSFGQWKTHFLVWTRCRQPVCPKRTMAPTRSVKEGTRNHCSHDRRTPLTWLPMGAQCPWLLAPGVSEGNRTGWVLEDSNKHQFVYQRSLTASFQTVRSCEAVQQFLKSYAHYCIVSIIFTQMFLMLYFNVRLFSVSTKSCLMPKGFSCPQTYRGTKWINPWTFKKRTKVDVY